ncbi:HU family DNA-binding protein [Mycoplasmopsis opalescens]|uniref:HU family DNA-binding protein n=1 Tax=Mycoplasmopsis opalescens TaxID=114886 RepID=UPI0004A76597|nr:HU family DNA-binding protein [Mycoplasmopsis opalescens]
MTKKELVSALAEDLQVPVRVADQFLDRLTFIIKEQLIAEEKVRVWPLGIFETTVKKGRETLNPFTRETMHVPEKRVVKFYPSKKLKEVVNF